MNGKDHVKKGLPILEDCLGGFAVVVSENDGVNPEIDLDMLGRHSVGTGSAPQNVIGSLVADPLDRVGMKITDIDTWSDRMGTDTGTYSFRSALYRICTGRYFKR